MTNGVYLMPKPECAPHLTYLDNLIHQSPLKITGVYEVKDWENTARRIYAPQLEVGSATFNQGFEEHVWLLKYMFGNRTVVLILNSEQEDLQTKLLEATKLKTTFRESRLGAEDYSFITMLNLDKIPDLNPDGLKGELGVKANKHFSIFGTNQFRGTWDYVFFKYVHSPDPELEHLYRELQVLTELGILDQENQLPLKEWDCMKKLKTLMPISELKK